MKQRADYTFKFNSNLGRHGWLRLTPAYSVKLVKESLKDESSESLIFDPFSGTGTTALVAAELGLNAALNDINPFLIWLAETKCRNYSTTILTKSSEKLGDIIQYAKSRLAHDNWLPDIYKIERWWDKATLKTLSALRRALFDIGGLPDSSSPFSMYWVSFCRLVIETSSAAFNHVSMSFKEKPLKYEEEFLLNFFTEITSALFENAKRPISGKVSVFKGDSRNLNHIENVLFTHVITSPPYSNRISYIRELRPYMYWLGFLEEAKEAGELDWEAIGGTWGTATSKLVSWSPRSNGLSPKVYDACEKISRSENKHSVVLSKYVLKYYHDMHLHLSSIRRLLADNAKLIYIVGNSTFYGVSVPADDFLKHSLSSLGFDDVRTGIIRKRNCKKELFEYCVSAVWKKTEKNPFRPMRQEESIIEQMTLQL
jgi:hypothetical protein